MADRVRDAGMVLIQRCVHVRRRALQAVYAWQISGGVAKQVIAHFAHEQAYEVADLVYFEDLVEGY